MTKKVLASFSRWGHEAETTWVFQVFDKYNEEMKQDMAAYLLASKYVYTELKKNGADLKDKISKHFSAQGTLGKYKNLEEWCGGYNHFDNWINLNMIMSISSNLETYLATVVDLALKSNPGTLLGSSQKIDGIRIIKYPRLSCLNCEEHVEQVTKGEWGSRLAAFIKIFGDAPIELKSNISTLELLRVLRNDIGHAFGRDIKASRNHEVKNIIPAKKMSRKRMEKIRNIVWEVARSIDNYLLEEHIGEFQLLHYYHILYESLDKSLHESERAIILKKEVGKMNVKMVNKDFCKELVKYYEAL